MKYVCFKYNLESAVVDKERIETIFSLILACSRLIGCLEIDSPAIWWLPTKIVQLKGNSDNFLKFFRNLSEKESQICRKMTILPLLETFSVLHLEFSLTTSDFILTHIILLQNPTRLWQSFKKPQFIFPLNPDIVNSTYLKKRRTKNQQYNLMILWHLSQGHRNQNFMHFYCISKIN